MDGLPRVNFYFAGDGETEQNRLQMFFIDEQYMRYFKLGYPRITEWLVNDG